MSGWMIVSGAVWILFAILTAAAASGRGRDASIWFLIGLAFGVFAFVAVLIGGDKSKA